MLTLEWVKQLLSRKFIIGVLCAVLGVVFINDVSGETKLDFLKWILGIYAVANVGQKVMAPTPEEDKV